MAAEKQYPEEPLRSVTIGQFRHTKTGLMQHSVAFKDKVSPEIFAQANQGDRLQGENPLVSIQGWRRYSGFLFASEAKAKQFAVEIDKLVKPAAAQAQDAPRSPTIRSGFRAIRDTYTKHADGRWSWAVSPAPVAKPNFLGANAEVIPKAEKALCREARRIQTGFCSGRCRREGCSSRRRHRRPIRRGDE